MNLYEALEEIEDDKYVSEQYGEYVISIENVKFLLKRIYEEQKDEEIVGINPNSCPHREAGYCTA